jgi:hypothetical protein
LYRQQISTSRGLVQFDVDVGFPVPMIVAILDLVFQESLPQVFALDPFFLGLAGCATRGFRPALLGM